MIKNLYLDSKQIKNFSNIFVYINTENFKINRHIELTLHFVLFKIRKKNNAQIS